MKILFLCHRLPYPPNKGDKIRSYNVLRYLAARHEVSVGTFLDDNKDARYIPEVASLTADCQVIALTPVRRFFRMAKALLTGQALSIAVFQDSVLRRWVDTCLASESFDLVIVFSAAMAPYILESEFPRDRVVFDMVDIDSDKWKQYSEVSFEPLASLYRREARRVVTLERAAARTFFRTCLVSQFETDSFAKICPEGASRLMTSRNGVDFSYYSPDLECENPFDPTRTAVVMTGRMDYRPNFEGARWLIQNVLPRLMKLGPDFHFYIVGAYPPSLLRSMSGAAVTVVGEVADIRPYLKHASVCVAPLQLARGVQNKVLEAMAMRKPVVATTVASRALGVKSEVELFIADTPADFANSILQACKREVGMATANRAYTFVREHFSWTTTLSALIPNQHQALDKTGVNPRRVPLISS